MKPISPEWIKQYIDGLLETAKMFGSETVMGQACLLHADHVMDMLSAWKEEDKD